MGQLMVKLSGRRRIGEGDVNLEYHRYGKEGAAACVVDCNSQLPGHFDVIENSDHQLPGHNVLEEPSASRTKSEVKMVFICYGIY